MALIPCPDCGREVSDQAVTCPFCGLPVKERLLQLQEEEEARLAQEEAIRRSDQDGMCAIVALVIAAVIILFVLHSAGVI